MRRKRNIGPALVEKHLGIIPVVTLHELLANRSPMTPLNLEPAYEADKQLDLRKPVHSILRTSTKHPVAASNWPRPTLLRRFASKCTKKYHLARAAPTGCEVLTPHLGHPRSIYLAAPPSALIAPCAAGL